MEFTIQCPSCKARLKGQPGLIGKTVNCPKCKTAIAVKGPSDTGAPARQPAPTKPPRKTEPEPVEDFEDLDERPARKPAPRKARDEDDYDDAPPPKKGKGRNDDDDYTDAPPKKGKGKPAPVDDFDDISADDDYDDAPKKGKGKKGAGIPTARVTEEDKTLAFNLYLYPLLLSLIPGCGGLLAMGYWLYLWLGKRKESPLLDWHGKQMLNQMISGFVVNIVVLVLYGIGAGVAVALEAFWPTLVFGGLGAVLGIGFALAGLVVFILGMMRAKAGIYYRFPTAFLQLLK